MRIRKHIDILIKAEEETSCRHRGYITFNRINDNTLSVSCLGYNHQDLRDVEADLIKAGCRYDFSRGIQQFDRVCGRTFTYLTEPKGE